MTSLEDQFYYEELERKIIGGIGVEPTLVPEVSRLIVGSQFSNKKNGAIFDIAIKLYEEGSEIDELNVSRYLRKNNINNINVSDVIECLRYSSPLDVLRYARDVAERYIKIQLGKATDRIKDKASSDSTNGYELLKEVRSLIDEIDEGSVYDVASATLDEITDDVVSYMEKGVEGVSSGVPSGLTELDEATNGWQNGDLIIVAGRPAMGKSAFVTSILKNAAEAGFPVALCSLEMSKFKVYCRLVAEDVGLFIGDLVNRRITREQLEHFKKTVQELRSQLKIIIDDDVDLSISELRVRARNWKRKYNIQLLVVDYLQLMSGDSGKSNSSSREQEISSISRGLKKIAKELDIPVIALSQLSRAVETRDNKRPMMSDLRESGSIEQDADKIFFLFRPEYYYKISGEECPEEYKDKCQLINGKDRDGDNQSIILEFLGHYSKFKDRKDLYVDLSK